MDHFVTMNRLPDGLQFPPDLKNRIEYDAGNHRLVFRGFMSKAEFDRLSKLSDDWSYRRPLEDLFRLCMPEETKPKGFARLVSALTGFGF